MKVFIDTNTFLAFFGTDSDPSSLFEFQKILKEKNSDVELVITQQLLDEYERNIGSKIDLSRQKVMKESFDIVVNATDYIKKEIEKDVEKIKEKVEIIKKKRLEGLEKRFSDTEKLIYEVFTLGTKISTTDEIIEKAKERFTRGNPPRKLDSAKDSYGDAINWESILFSVSDNLTIVSYDPDYAELFKGEKIINRFLKKEWEKKGKKIKLYPQLGIFINSLEKKSVIPKEAIEKEVRSSDMISIQKPLTYRILTTEERIFPASDTISASVLSGIPSFTGNSVRVDEGGYLRISSDGARIGLINNSMEYKGASAVEIQKISDHILHGARIDMATGPLGYSGGIDIMGNINPTIPKKDDGNDGNKSIV